VAGGMSIDTNPKDYLMQYDAERDVWKSLASMPTARYATYSFLIHDKLYVLGMSFFLRVLCFPYYIHVVAGLVYCAVT